eukprot:TRINITY_DN51477_c0_g1_i1.p1 TRINITY_DN51477_c0_g1~~TRINITY_DN51477_c0_g1_i1.p1  ORF type:complete len:285 (-),score=133.86 TRINITY_DN51477_c0_g1_i1:184-1038(-)
MLWTIAGVHTLTLSASTALALMFPESPLAQQLVSQFYTSEATAVLFNNPVALAMMRFMIALIVAASVGYLSIGSNSHNNLAIKVAAIVAKTAFFVQMLQLYSEGFATPVGVVVGASDFVLALAMIADVKNTRHVRTEGGNATLYKVAATHAALIGVPSLVITVVPSLSPQLYDMAMTMFFGADNLGYVQGSFERATMAGVFGMVALFYTIGYYLVSLRPANNNAMKIACTVGKMFAFGTLVHMYLGSLITVVPVAIGVSDVVLAILSFLDWSATPIPNKSIKTQ